MKRRVLVVDDDALTREVLGTVLDIEDFEVATAPDGETALVSAAGERPDVVVLDVMMPGIDGLEVCRRLRADAATADVAIVMLTAKDRPEDRRAGEAAGADAYLTKPFSPLQLIALLHDLDHVTQAPMEGTA